MTGKEKANGSVFLASAVMCAAVILAIAAVCYIVSEELMNTPKKDMIVWEKLPYRTEVAAASEAYGVEETRIYAVIQVESSFVSDACSKAGAIGLMQMIPPTYEEQCVALGRRYDPEDLKKPEVNIDVCTYYLQELHNMTGSWDWAHIAYNMGIDKVIIWQREGYTPKTVPSDRAKLYLEKIKSAYDAYSVAFAAAKSEYKQ